MRTMLLASAMACFLAVVLHARPAAAAGLPGPSMTAAPVVALQIPDKKIEITIGEHGAIAAWYRNPVWIAIGILAVVVLILLVVLISRGGGTTIVKD